MGWVVDLDGVLWRGDEPIAGASEAVAELDRRGEQLVFVTNMSTHPVAAQEEKLGRHGIDASGRVITSAMAVARLVEGGERVLCCSGPGVVQEVMARGAEVVTDGACDAVIVGFHTDFDYDRLRRASLAVRAGARLLASNDDATYPTPSGLWPGNGALLAAVEKASGARAVVAGKPNEPVAALVRERLGAEGIVVGDRPDTDGEFAVTLGYRFGLVLSGVTTAADLPVVPAPDVVAHDLAELVAGFAATAG